MCQEITIHTPHKEEWPSDPFHKEFMSSLIKSCKNTCKSFVKNNDPTKSQFGTCHHSSVVVACAKLGLDRIIWINIRTTKWSQNFNYELKPFVKWSPDLWCSWCPGEGRAPGEGVTSTDATCQLWPASPKYSTPNLWQYFHYAKCCKIIYNLHPN